MGKRKKRQQRMGICVYCGREGPITRDHPIPETLFLVLDEDMVTAPACDDCNRVKSLGDRDFATT